LANARRGCRDSSHNASRSTKLSARARRFVAHGIAIAEWVLHHEIHGVRVDGLTVATRGAGIIQSQEEFMTDVSNRARWPRMLASLALAGGAIAPIAAHAQVFPLFAADYRGVGVYSVDPGGAVTVHGFVPGPLNSVRRDADGNLYTCSEESADVSRIDGAGTVTVYATGFDGCFGLLFAADGTLYVSNVRAGRVQAVPPGGGAAVTVAAGLATPMHMALAADGAILVTEFGGGRLSRVDGSGAVTTVAAGLDSPVGVAIGRDGNAYVSELWTGRIVRVAATGATSVVVTLPDAGPSGLAVHEDGRLFVGELFVGRIDAVDVGTGATSVFRDGLVAPVGLAFLASSPAPLPLTVSIVLGDGGDADSINPSSHGVTPVAVVGSPGFDARRIDPASVRFGAAGVQSAPVKSAVDDIDGDGWPDMVLHFRTRALGIPAGLSRGSTVALQLTGLTLDGVSIAGAAAARVVGPGR
jgi:sugar lactone lactonase YvrE